MTHVVALIHEEDGVFGISFPDFPGCISTADNLDDVMARGATALTFHVEGMVEDGEECWAFWVYPEELPPGADDTTSYVHADLSIEWYGTSWVPSQEALAA